MVIKMSDQQEVGILEGLLDEMRNFNIGLFNREERLRRIEICVACPNFEPVKVKCGICRCSIAPMVLMHSHSCPDGRWVTDDPNDPSEDAQTYFKGDGENPEAEAK